MENERTTKDCMVTVILDGAKTMFPLSPSGEDILEASLARGMDIPYSCKSGICSTCMAKILEGKVEMEITTALTQEEINKGYILTCQSHPRSETLTISFDD